jgi:hypothetical protein
MKENAPKFQVGDIVQRKTSAWDPQRGVVTAVERNALYKNPTKWMYKIKLYSSLIHRYEFEDDIELVVKLTPETDAVFRDILRDV